jgi:radical SAM superfamily enzyme YgiQ (UPF0313 family)
MNKSFFVKRNSNRRLNVMFGDLNYFNNQTIHTQYIPLAIGLIAQYAKQQFGNDINLSLFKSVDKFLNQAAKNPPDVVGLSVYYWNISLNQYLVKCLREKYGQDVIIILGGPCIDSDTQEQYKYLSKVFPGVNGIVLNEGEISFSNILLKIFENRDTVFKDPIDGVSFLDGNLLVKGRPIGLTMDLSTMGSPYLSGLMDDFMNSDNQPLIQTSRFCPYTCAFCVSGKNRGKLRGYPIEQVKEELMYVSKKYADRPYHTMFMADENFGIIKRDVEIAEAIKKCKDDFGFPQSVMFYNDKRFTETSRKIQEILAEQTQRGVILALQTENPLSLQAINRRNVTDEQISDAIAWAKGLNLNTSTDLIFGLPHDTSDSFIEVLDRSIKRGFDHIGVVHLLLMDGIEMNRQDFREKYNLKTKYRILGTNYTKHNDTFLAEHEEVVVSSNSFTYENFLEVRFMSFMFYAVFNLNFQKWFFQFARHLGINTTKFFSHFFKPDQDDNLPERYIRFLDDLKNAMESELHDTRDEMVDSAKKMFEANGNDVGESRRININFCGRLNYLEKEWVKPVLLYHLDKIMKGNLSNKDRDLASLLIDLSERERVDLKNISEKKPLNISFDVINWKQNKFKEPLHNLKMPERSLVFSTDKSQVSVIEGFQKRFATCNDQDYYHEVAERIRPRRFLLHNLSYE